MKCLDENTVLALVDGRLDESARALAESHVATCQSCADVIATAVGAAPADAPHDSPAASPHPTFARGATIGRYVVIDLVGRGGMGEVYAAYDPQLDRKVALKLLHDTAARGMSAGMARARLLREAKAIARLSHPNVVVVHDAGEIDDRVFLAMEFVEGETLAIWLEEHQRGWREIVDVFVAAGRGLAAAHQAGLIHRDFKPQNAMVGSDGSVRVMDFGLASDAGGSTGDAAGPPVAPEGDLGSPHTAALTRSGLLMGTPAYMAPEQFLGQAADARTDQFSFCVALYDALFGERPFPTHSFSALVEAVVAGRVRDLSQRARAPLWLRKLLLRGLDADPAKRFSSMPDLLEALSRDPARGRRRLLAGSAIALAAVAAVLGSQRLATRGQRLCRGAPGKLETVWEPTEGAGSRRAGVHQAFLSTGKPFAEETWQRVAATLDDYGRRWAGMYTDACEATHVRGDQSAEVLDLRMACLEGPLGGLRALTGVLARADAAVVVQSVSATQALPALDRCANVPLLRATVEPPADAPTRARVDGVRAGVAHVKALHDTGQWREALAQSYPLVQQARAAHYGPSLAEALSMNALLEVRAGSFAAGARASEEGLWAAITSHRDDVAVETAAILASCVGYNLGRYEEAERWQRLGEALVGRLGPGQERAAAWLVHGRGMIRQRQGDHRAAISDFRRAVALKEKVLSPRHPDVAFSREALANSFIEIGDLAGAQIEIDATLAILRGAYGAESPLLARPLGNRGEVLLALGKNAQAEADLRDAIKRWADLVEPDHPWVAYPLTALGETLIAEGRAPQAVPVLERAVRIRERSDPGSAELAQSQFALARASWDAGGDPARARALASTAADLYRPLPRLADRTGAIEAWLAAHARRREQPPR